MANALSAKPEKEAVFKSLTNNLNTFKKNENMHLPEYWSIYR